MNKVILLLTLLLSALAHGASAQDTDRESIEPYTASFVAAWGEADTASVETFTIIGHHLFGRALHLYPEPHLRQFQFWYDSDGSIRSLDIQFFEASNTSVPLESKTGFLPYRMIMNPDNAMIDFRLVDGQGEHQYLHAANRMDFLGGWIPIIGQWQWLSSLLTDGSLADSLVFANYAIGVYDMELFRDHDGNVVFVSGISAPITFSIDEDENIVEIDAMGSPWNYTIRRTRRPLNIEEYAPSFAGKAVIGDPSPTQQFATEIGGTIFRVSYGRPFKRGRVIFGNVVPYGRVWRSGAGAATTLAFDKVVRFGGRTMPAGTYNLFTIPGEEVWQLVFNTEASAWGSAHRAEFDIAEIEMEAVRLDHVVDQFTIAIEETVGGGVLKLMWDETLAQVAFEVVD
jgi:hypothetical protein